MTAEEGVAGGGIMAVIMEAEDGEAISEATGVVDPEVVGLSTSDLTDEDLTLLQLAALRLKHSILNHMASKLIIWPLKFLYSAQKLLQKQ